MTKNLLLSTDVYKMGHHDFYPNNTTKIYSYLTARSDKKINELVFFGLQYYIKEYLMRIITKEDVEEFCELKQEIVGSIGGIKESLLKLVALGYLPLEIKAVPEGTIIPCKNVIMTITNTHPDFAWLVGFFESLLLKLWAPITVASFSHKLKNVVNTFASKTCDNFDMTRFQIHDFGFRGCSAEETAAILGASHLLNFYGTDTVPAIKFHKDYYNGISPIGLSVPATEHSVACAYKQECEFEYFEAMLNICPTGIVSIVSDTYNLWNVLTDFASRLKSRIMTREGKVVFRPDSGDPELIICGDSLAPSGTNEFKGALQLLWEQFGGTINSKGYKVLDPHVGLIYGDGIYFERFERILQKMKDMGFASSNIVFGIGGLLLQQHSRDDMGFAIKATYCVVNGEERELMKDPITDHKKKSLKGLMGLFLEDGKYVTKDELTWDQEKTGLLQTVFKDGELLIETNLQEIRERCGF